MSNKIFETIFNRKLESFVSTFVEDSESIFFIDNQLIHPGEYGKYRENSAKDLIQMLTKYKVSDGFIITSNDKVSTQCDLVIYDNLDFPILENNFTQFFSIESVISIGEVKSTLSKTEFKKALIKLSENKKLSENIEVKPKSKSRSKDYDSPISFLVCKNLSFDISTIDFENIYDGISREYWHNLILVVDKGLFTYQFCFQNLNSQDKDLFIAHKGIVDSYAFMESPSFYFAENRYDCEHYFIELEKSSKFRHINFFLTALSQSISYKTLYETQIIKYSGLPSANIFNK